MTEAVKESISVYPAREEVIEKFLSRPTTLYYGTGDAVVKLWGSLIPEMLHDHNYEMEKVLEILRTFAEGYFIRALYTEIFKLRPEIEEKLLAETSLSRFRDELHYRQEDLENLTELAILYTDSDRRILDKMKSRFPNASIFEGI